MPEPYDICPFVDANTPTVQHHKVHGQVHAKCDDQHPKACVNASIPCTPSRATIAKT